MMVEISLQFPSHRNSVAQPTYARGWVFVAYSIGKEKSESSPSDSVPDFLGGDGGAWHASGCQRERPTSRFGAV